MKSLNTDGGAKKKAAPFFRTQRYPEPGGAQEVHWTIPCGLGYEDGGATSLELNFCRSCG